MGASAKRLSFQEPLADEETNTKKAGDRDAGDHTLGAARADVYRQMDEARRTALDKRAGVMADTKRDVETALHDATAQLTAQAAAARAALDGEAADLANAIVTRVLGRTA